MYLQTRQLVLGGRLPLLCLDVLQEGIIRQVAEELVLVDVLHPQVSTHEIGRRGLRLTGSTHILLSSPNDGQRDLAADIPDTH